MVEQLVMLSMTGTLFAQITTLEHCPVMVELEYVTGLGRAG